MTLQLTSVVKTIEVDPRVPENHDENDEFPFPQAKPCSRGGGGILGISGWGCAAETLEPLAYTRASSAEFCYPILE